MTSLPSWAVYAVSFGSPAAAFLGVLIGHLVSRRGASELDRRAKREETMRTLRWATALVVSEDGRSARLGLAALDALSASPWLQVEDQAFIDTVLEALLETDAQVYRGADVAGHVEIVQVDDQESGSAAAASEPNRQEEER